MMVKTGWAVGAGAHNFSFLDIMIHKDGINIWVDIINSNIYSGGYVNFLAKMFIFN